MGLELVEEEWEAIEPALDPVLDTVQEDVIDPWNESLKEEGSGYGQGAYDATHETDAERSSMTQQANEIAAEIGQINQQIESVKNDPSYSDDDRAAWLADLRARRDQLIAEQQSTGDPSTYTGHD